MVPSKIRFKKRIRSRGTFREVNASGDYERSIETNEGTEEPPFFRNNNNAVHVYATQRIKHCYLLHGDYRKKSDDYVDLAFVRSDCRQCDWYDLLRYQY